MSRRTAFPVAPFSATVAPEPEENVLRFDDAPEFSYRPHEDDTMDDMDQQVREAQHRLAALRAQQEEVERQKQILEALRQKQERFVSGKKEVTEKLERALRSITEELEDTRRRVDDLALTQKDFEDRLDDLKTYLPERWQRSQLDHELDRALDSLNEAETSYEKGVRRLIQHRPTQAEATVHHAPSHSVMTAQEESVEVHAAGEVLFAAGNKDDLLAWARRGFAFNATLIIALVLLLIIARLMF